MTDGFQLRRAPVVKNNRPSTARVVFAVGISLAGMAPFFVMAGFPFLDGDFSRLLELVPVVFFGAVVFLVIRFADRQRNMTINKAGYFGNESFPNDPRYSSAYKMRNESTDLSL